MSFDDSSQSASTALSHSQSTGRGCGCVVTLFFSVMIVAGVIATFVLFFIPLGHYVEAGNWVETPCTISAIHLKQDSGQFHIEIRYDYSIHGNKHQGNRYSLFDNEGGQQDDKLEMVNQIIGNPPHKCFVNPDDPGESVFSRDFSSSVIFGLIPLFFVFVGLIGITFSRQMAQKFIAGRLSKTKNQEWRTETAIQEQDQTSLEDWQKRDWQTTSESSGPIELKSGSSPFGMLLFLLLFSLFWNGIVSVFVLEVLTGWGQGKPDWFLTFFMIPFLLVGLGTLLGVAYMFLALFNPKPRLFVSDSTTILGETFNLSWQFRGSTSSIRKFQIQLIGTEWAQYRQGTKTHTDTKEFYRENLFETDQPMEMSEGELEVTIPDNTMHSFNATNNKIKWRLKLIGDIPRWPDVNQDYDFTVLPLRVD